MLRQCGVARTSTVCLSVTVQWRRQDVNCMLVCHDALASPGFGIGAWSGTKVSGCLHKATVDIIVTVRLCIGQSALKKLL